MIMVSITPMPPGYGIVSLLQTFNTNTSNSLTGIFSAISGGASSSTGTNIFNSISPGSSGSSIDGILQQQKVTTQTNAIYTNVAQRLSAMQTGAYQPSADWEKVAAYAMQSGQPVVVSLDNKGQIQASPQSQADLSKYNQAQQKQLLQAMTDISTMSDKIQANKTNQGLIDKLTGAETDLTGVFTGQLPPQTAPGTEWEAQGVQLMTMNKPFTISLDPQGNLQVQDQVTAPNTDLPADQQKALQAAAEAIPTIIGSNGLVTQQWQADAQNFAQNGVPYHLEVDTSNLDFSPITDNYGFAVDANGNRTLGTNNPPALHNGTPSIIAVENSGDNIVPDFLKTAPYPDIGNNTPLLQSAENFIQSGQSYFLDIGSTGQVEAKAATAQNIIKYNTPSQTAAQPLSLGSVLSIIA